MKEYSTLVVIKNIQTKPKWNITMYLLELLKLKRLTKPSVGDNVKKMEELEVSNIPNSNVKWNDQFEK